MYEVECKHRNGGVNEMAFNSDAFKEEIKEEIYKEICCEEYVFEGRGKYLYQNRVAIFTKDKRGVRHPTKLADVNIAGVLMDGAAITDGETGLFKVVGIAEIRCACDIEIGDWLVIADEDGRVMPGGQEWMSHKAIVGRAITNAETDEYVRVILTPERW